jgi:hypothetical protein
MRRSKLLGFTVLFFIKKTTAQRLVFDALRLNILPPAGLMAAAVFDAVKQL